METISIKFQEDVLERIDKCIITHNFNSRTEFIREAVRDKLSDLSREELVAEFLKLHGKSRIKTNDKDDARIRAQASKELLADLKQRFDIR